MSRFHHEVPPGHDFDGNNADPFWAQPTASREGRRLAESISIPSDQFGEQVPRKNPRYYLEKKSIGAGGFAEVFRAYDARENRWVAVKKQPLIPRKVGNRHIIRQYLLHENQVSRKFIDHPNVVGVYERFREDDGHGDCEYLVMELLGDGFKDLTNVSSEYYIDFYSAVSVSLDSKSKKDAREQYIKKVFALFSTLAKTLDSLWVDSSRHGSTSYKVVHRDITPENILVNGDKAKIIDFGRSYLIAEDTLIEDAREYSIHASIFHAPNEVFLGKVAINTDVYGLASILYEFLCFDSPMKVNLDHFSSSPEGQSSEEDFDEADVVFFLSRHNFEKTPARLHLQKYLETELSLWNAPEIVDVFSTALEVNPEKRYKSCVEFITNLEQAFYSAHYLGWKEEGNDPTT